MPDDKKPQSASEDDKPKDSGKPAPIQLVKAEVKELLAREGKKRKDKVDED